MMYYDNSATYQSFEYPNTKVTENYCLKVAGTTDDVIQGYWRLHVDTNEKTSSNRQWNTLETDYSKLSIDKDTFYKQWSNAVDLIIKYDHIEACHESMLELFLMESFETYQQSGIATEFLIKYYRFLIKITM